MSTRLLALYGRLLQLDLYEKGSPLGLAWTMNEKSLESGETETVLGNEVGAELSADTPFSAAELETFDSHVQAQLHLSSQLEVIADSLPDGARTVDVHIYSDAIPKVLKNAHAFEENVLFPRLRSTNKMPELILELMDRLEDEHRQDWCFAEEVSQALREFATGEANLSADALGYMLRGLFVSLRRHVEKEKDLMAQVLGKEPRLNG